MIWMNGRTADRLRFQLTVSVVSFPARLWNPDFSFRNTLGLRATPVERSVFARIRFQLEIEVESIHGANR